MNLGRRTLPKKFSRQRVVCKVSQFIHTLHQTDCDNAPPHTLLLPNHGKSHAQQRIVFGPLGGTVSCDSAGCQSLWPDIQFLDKDTYTPLDPASEAEFCFSLPASQIHNAIHTIMHPPHPRPREMSPHREIVEELALETVWGTETILLPGIDEQSIQTKLHHIDIIYKHKTNIVRIIYRHTLSLGSDDLLALLSSPYVQKLSARGLNDKRLPFAATRASRYMIDHTVQSR